MSNSTNKSFFPFFFPSLKKKYATAFGIVIWMLRCYTRYYITALTDDVQQETDTA